MIKSYFQLFDEPNKFLSVMEDLQNKVNDSKEQNELENSDKEEKIN